MILHRASWTQLTAPLALLSTLYKAHRSGKLIDWASQRPGIVGDLSGDV